MGNQKKERKKKEGYALSFNIIFNNFLENFRLKYTFDL